MLLVLCKGVNKVTHSTLVLGVFCEFSYLLSYPGYFREPPWIHSMGIPEISRVTWRVFVLSCSSGKPFAWSPCHEWPTNTRKKTMNSTCMGSRTGSTILTTHNSTVGAAVLCRHPSKEGTVTLWHGNVFRRISETGLWSLIIVQFDQHDQHSCISDWWKTTFHNLIT